MSIDKIKHGSEITSAKLNEIIDTVNDTAKEHSNIRNLSKSIEQTVAEVYNQLETYSEQVGEHLDSIPEIKSLYADILLARDSVDWIEVADNETDVAAQIANALSGYEGETEEPAQRLRIIRGPNDKIQLVEKKDKQILIGYELDEERNVLNGIMYFDYFDSKSGSLQRCPVSSSRDATITISAPELSFFTTLEGEVKLQASYNGTVQSISPNLKGEDGAPGIQGPKGERGERGEKGLDGARGDRGPQGEDGPATLINVLYSQYSTGLNPSETYQENKHKYMGIRSYLSNMTTDEIKAQPIKWFRITGDTLYPIYDKDTGCLTFTTTIPDEPLNFYIKGDRGPQGEKGEAPSLAFKVIQDGKEILQPLEFIDANGNRVYDLTSLKGEKGESIKFSNLTAEEKEYLRGQKGDKGDKPTISFMVEHTDKTYPTIKDTTPDGSPFDAVFTISLPKGQDGKDGENGQNGKDGENGKDGYSIVDLSIDSATGNGTVILARDVVAYENKEDTPTKTISIGKIIGDKGEDGVGIDSIILTQQDGRTKVYTVKLTNGTEAPIIVQDGKTGEKGSKGDPGEKGEQGPAGTITLGNVSTTDSKSDASVSISGTAENAILNFVIPRGEKGDKGDSGTSLNISSSIYTNIGSLPSFSSANVNDAFILKTANSYDLYFKAKDGSTWTILNDWGGVQGPPGTAATITVDSKITTLPAGQDASVINSGDSLNAKLTFMIPKGDKGDAATIALSPTTVTLEPDKEAYVENIGDANNAILAFSIPRGEKGEPGESIKGDTGPQGPTGADGLKIVSGTDVTLSSSGILNKQLIPETLNKGDLYLNTNTFNLYKVTVISADTYTLQLLGNIKGPTGDTATIESVSATVGTTAAVKNTGTKENAKLEFTLPIGEQGEQGPEGRGIDSIEYIGSGTDNENRTTKTYQINFTDGLNPVQFTLTDGKDGANGTSVTHSWSGTKLTITSASGTTTTDLKGQKGDTGISITSVNKTSSSDNIDTYTITFSNGSTTTFTVTNGIDGNVGNKGADGSDGRSIHIHDGNIPPTTIASGSMQKNDYILINTGEIYEVTSITPIFMTPTISNINTEFTGITLKGPKGDVGPSGEYIKATKTTISDAAVDVTIPQSYYYELTNTAITSLKITTGTVTANTVGEFMFQFTISSDGNRPSTITLKNSAGTTIPYANGWTIYDFIPGFKYTVYIVNDIAYVSFIKI